MPVSPDSIKTLPHARTLLCDIFSPSGWHGNGFHYLSCICPATLEPGQQVVPDSLTWENMTLRSVAWFGCANCNMQYLPNAVLDL
jgi:hypothetical protein